MSGEEWDLLEVEIEAYQGVGKYYQMVLISATL